ncbi:MAG: phasin family protein [Acidobacteriota bacterium]
MKKVQEHTVKSASELAQDVTETGRSIWLAGLGAVARVEEGGRELFDHLVEKGRKVEKRQFKAIDRTVARTSQKVQEIGDKVQSTVEDGMKGTLHRMGLATLDDVQSLQGHIEALTKKVDEAAAAPRA